MLSLNEFEARLAVREIRKENRFRPKPKSMIVWPEMFVHDAELLFFCVSDTALHESIHAVFVVFVNFSWGIERLFFSCKKRMLFHIYSA